MVHELYGSKWHASRLARETLRKLSSAASRGELTLAEFVDFSRNHPALLFPAFQLQSFGGVFLKVAAAPSGRIVRGRVAAAPTRIVRGRADRPRTGRGGAGASTRIVRGRVAAGPRRERRLSAGRAARPTRRGGAVARSSADETHGESADGPRRRRGENADHGRRIRGRAAAPPPERGIAAGLAPGLPLERGTPRAGGASGKRSAARGCGKRSARPASRSRRPRRRPS